MNSPNAPISAVDEIIKTFRGVAEVGGTDGWLVTFDDHDKFQNSLALINMLQGWKAKRHPNILNMIRIYSV